MSQPTEPTTALKANENEKPLQELREGSVDTVESNFRYLGYAARLRTLATAGSRYLAYTSDVGEAFRPLVNPVLVRSCYGISWLYIGFDVFYEGYKAKLAGSDNTSVGLTLVKRSVFQSIASMALPAFTIHSVVKYASGMAKNIKNQKLRVWTPTALGLAVVPFLPYLFDHAVEKAVDFVFEEAEKKVTGHQETPAMSPNAPTNTTRILSDDKKNV
ncbi:hypothetical protein K493DRAFT_315674 [Basidiobolus meristosporus CBS 931.73]|uniref:Mitochondrial fission process protein 1 n=1 Tax=Basidiobolus meristosporus CBS 931.73 TaxID=1314790 RepID=A0A1Y1Y911_9FUNG|nr:hypothetical protein K493DRAFT_315674 [Basidiobolus meristosporus CBS 931.73]|eukprot:ORX94044.1 hypothetical protein K493DRAFT_315674 [Basidiobolus meristosporus CBS 931.73]